MTRISAYNNSTSYILQNLVSPAAFNFIDQLLFDYTSFQWHLCGKHIYPLSPFLIFVRSSLPYLTRHPARRIWPIHFPMQLSGSLICESCHEMSPNRASVQSGMHSPYYLTSCMGLTVRIR